MHTPYRPFLPCPSLWVHYLTLRARTGKDMAHQCHNLLRQRHNLPPRRVKTRQLSSYKLASGEACHRKQSGSLFVPNISFKLGMASAVGPSAYGVISTNPNGVNWATRKLPPNRLQAVFTVGAETSVPNPETSTIYSIYSVPSLHNAWRARYMSASFLTIVCILFLAVRHQ